MENDTGSWRLFGGVAVQPYLHYPTLNYSTYEGHLIFTKNKSLTDSLILATN